VNRKTRAMVGVVTTTVFIVIGMSVLMGGSTKVGAVLMALGLLRGSFASRQISALFEDEDED
jgi:hypothetical protein